MNETKRRPSFRELVDLLTEPTTRKVLRDTGKTSQVSVDGLLVQLRAAVFGGMEGTGASSSFAAKPPLDPAAVDLLEEITEQAAKVLAIAKPSPTPFGHAEQYVRLWSALVSESQVVHFTVRSVVPSQVDPETYVPGKPSVFDERVESTAYDLVASWVDRVETFFNPPSSREIQAACPVCGARYVERFKDGEITRSAALNIRRERATGRPVEAKCAACTATWEPDKFEFLAELVGATPAELTEEAKARSPRLVLSQECDAGVHELCESVVCECSCAHNKKGA